MKTVTLRILQDQLTWTDAMIKQKEKELADVKKIADQFQERGAFSDHVNEVHNFLSSLNKIKLELLDCIDWVKSVEKKDLTTHRT